MSAESTSGKFDDNVEEAGQSEADEMSGDKLVRMDDGTTAWMHNGIMYGLEDIMGNYELMDEMPMGMRNVMIPGNEIAKYMDWKQEEIKGKTKAKQIEEAQRKRALISALGIGKNAPSLSEWLGKEEGTPDPGHTETEDDDLDWADLA